VGTKRRHDTKRDTEGEKDLSRSGRPNITALCEYRNIPLANVNLDASEAPVGEALDQKAARTMMGIPMVK
jgi:hypothetical protein